jgi:hypothetical protein
MPLKPTKYSFAYKVGSLNVDLLNKLGYLLNMPKLSLLIG